MAYALIAHREDGSTDGNTFTTTGIDTTGADLLVAYVSEYEPSTDTVLTDSKSNTWATDITERKDVGTASLLGRMFYATNVGAKVGAAHTFTVTGATGRAAIAIAAFSGSHLTAPLDQQNGTVDIDAGLSNTTGSVTPSEGDCVIVTGLAFSGGSTGNTITIDSSFTKTGQVDLDGSNHRGVALAYLIETSVVAQNPTWSYTNNQYVVTTIASFKKAAGGGGGGGAATRDLTTLLCGQ